MKTNIVPLDTFYISFDTKRRNTIPLVKTTEENKRIIDISDNSKSKYEELKKYKDDKYAYVKGIKKIC